MQAHGDQGSSPVTRKGKSYITIQERGFEELQAGLAPVPGEMTDQMLLEIMSRHTKDKNVSQNSQHRFTKGKLCLTYLIISYHKAMGSVEEARAVNSIRSLVRIPSYLQHSCGPARKRGLHR